MKDQNEVQQLMAIYMQAVDTRSKQNRFRACLYNQIPNYQNLKREETQFFIENVPREFNGIPVDLHKWLQAVETNPDKARLVPTQISSTAQLKERVQ